MARVKIDIEDLVVWALTKQHADVSRGSAIAGDAEVYASVKLDVSVSGAGNVRYKGNAVVNKSVSGAGSVKKVE